MGDTSQTRARTRSWTDEQKQAAREREQLRRAEKSVQDPNNDEPLQPTGFVAFPAWMLADRSISDLGKWVILALSMYASKDGRCWPTAATLARTLNRSERTVFRGLQEVVELGLVSVHPRYRRGLQISSVYQLEFARWGSAALRPVKIDIPGMSKSSSPGCQNLHAEQDPESGSTEQVDPPNPPTGGKEERAPRAAVGRKAGEGKARGPRPRMVRLREELLQRLDAWNPALNPLEHYYRLKPDPQGRIDGRYVLDQLRANDEWLSNQLALSWVDGDLDAALDHYADRLSESVRVPDPARAVRRAVTEVADRLPEKHAADVAALRAQVEADYARGDLDARQWRAKLGPLF